MYPGQYTLCLKTSDLEGMLRFYEALGMTTRVFAPNSAMAWNGDVYLALMTFLQEHSMNFRGRDPFEVYGQATETGRVFEGQPERYEKAKYKTDADGSNWLTHDPDGNNVFFDTNQNETGPVGARRAMQKVVLRTRRQLANIGAFQSCRDAFEAEVVDVFAPKEQAEADQVPFYETAQTFPGFFNYCLKTSDNDASRDWYSALGLRVGAPAEGEFVQIGTPDCSLSLMTFLPENWLNFRGADVFEIHERMKQAGLEPEGEPSRYTAEEYGSPGAHWQTRDPDGNQVYFDTTDEELITPKDPLLQKRILETSVKQLEPLEVDQACSRAIRSVLDRLTQ